MYVFLPTFYLDSEFHSIQACLCMFKLLLQFHEPTVANYLEEHNITADIYAYNWFLTYFSSKLALDPLYRLWEKIIRERDVFMIFYISVAILIRNKELIYATDKFELPSLMAGLTMNTDPEKGEDEVEAVFKIAQAVKAQTPHSFTYIIIMEQILT